MQVMIPELKAPFGKRSFFLVLVELIYLEEGKYLQKQQKESIIKLSFFSFFFGAKVLKCSLEVEHIKCKFTNISE